MPTCDNQLKRFISSLSQTDRYQTEFNDCRCGEVRCLRKTVVRGLDSERSGNSLRPCLIGNETAICSAAVGIRAAIISRICATEIDEQDVDERD